MADSRMGRAELRLNPPELGPLEVSLNVNSDEVSVSFQAQHAATREAVENALPRLREMLAQNGLTLANADVSQQSKQDSGGHQPQARASTVAAGEDSASEGPHIEPAPVSVLGSAAGLLDTYA
jgi:flagellar hook-length control protein FliK